MMAALPLLIACCAIDQEGRLCLRGRDRISQLVGAVGGKGTLGLQRRAQSNEKTVHIADDRRQLHRQPITGDRRQVRAVAHFQFLPQETDRPHRPAHGQPDN